jgi:hypothetical protein
MYEVTDLKCAVANSFPMKGILILIIFKPDLNSGSAILIFDFKYLRAILSASRLSGELIEYN